MIGNRIRALKDKKGITVNEIAQFLGTSRSAVSGWINQPDKRTPNPEQIKKMAELFGVTEQDLFAPEKKEQLVKDELTKYPDKYLKLLPKKIIPQDIKTIPLVNGYVGAGSFGINEDIEPIDKIYVDIHAIEKAYRNKELKAIRVIGDSMSPYVNDMDIVLYYEYKEGECPTGDGKYIIETPSGEQVKNIKFMLNGNIRIISENPSYHTQDGYDEEIEKDSQEYFKILGKVVGRIMRG